MLELVLSLRLELLVSVVPEVAAEDEVALPPYAVLSPPKEFMLELLVMVESAAVVLRLLASVVAAAAVAAAAN